MAATKQRVSSPVDGAKSFVRGHPRPKTFRGSSGRICLTVYHLGSPRWPLCRYGAVFPRGIVRSQIVPLKTLPRSGGRLGPLWRMRCSWWRPSPLCELGLRTFWFFHIAWILISHLIGDMLFGLCDSFLTLFVFWYLKTLTFRVNLS